MLKEKIKEFVQAHKDEIVSDLMELIKIPSVSTDAEACKRMLLATKALYEKNGFETKTGDEYLLAYYGNGEKSVGLFAHGDVVEGGHGWTLTSPFEPKIVDGRIVGRGAWDDKAAIVCSLYAVRALRDLGASVKKRIVCFTGFNEENGMTDIPKYLKTNTPPDFSLVLDAGFPIYNGDKGKSWVEVRSRESLNDIIEIGGGRSINIILGNAEARLKKIEGLFAELTDILEKDEINKKLLSIKEEGEEIHVFAKGVSAHGANPEGSVNGAYLISSFLSKSNRINPIDKKIMGGVSEILSSYYGESVGIDSKTEEGFGRLTMTNGITRVENGRLYFTLDLRYGKATKTSQMLPKLKEALDNYGFDTVVINSDEAYSVDVESENVKRCLHAFSQCTGVENPKPRINAGSTYAKLLGNACETGMSYGSPHLSLPVGHGAAHQPDENISIDGLLNAIEIITFMVSEVCK